MTVERAERSPAFQVDHDDDRTPRAGVSDIAGSAIRAEADVVQIGPLKRLIFRNGEGFGYLIACQIDADELGPTFEIFSLPGAAGSSTHWRCASYSTSRPDMA
ncbi:hypothetical protein FHT02_002708 [Sphingomonas xinjiangensis]|uniref:Uncharacterized protein n=1 Tax=Sphingomonas xinjiangensis TaxID=643568 RepID=A0A840YQX4_9SPHN|nr:hypothetical protein [Sphingomonas xinjiangensis]